MARILIIEDDPLMSRMYQKIFTFEGYEVDLADNGADGLEKVRSQKPNLILLDIMMPEMDGFAVLHELKKDPDTKDCEVIMLTNLSDNDAYRKAVQLGANGFLIKIETPPEKLIEEVEKHLHG